MKRGILAVSLLVLLALPGIAFGVGVEFAFGVWSQEPSGNLSYKALTANDTINIANDLNYGSKTKFLARAKIDMPLLLPNLYLMATPMKFDGAGSKTVNFRFGDFTFSQNVPFTSEVDLTHYDIGFYYGLPFIRAATSDMFNVDVGLVVRIVDFDASITQPATALTQRKSLTVPVPLAYLAAQVSPLEWLALEGELRAMAISGNKYYSLTGRVKAKVFGPVFVAGGYRYDKIDIDESDVVLDATIDGFFVEAGAEF